jgi:hypothetical protein
MNKTNSNQSAILRWLLMALVLLGVGSLQWKLLSARPKKTDPAIMAASQGQNAKVDKQADKLLKQMSDYLTAMNQFSYKSKGEFEVVDNNNKKQKLNYNSEIFVKRPNKMRVNVKNESRDASVFYDGKLFTVLGRNANMYAQAEAPATLDAALDSAREKFLLDPPGSDILYTNPYKGLMELVSQGKFMGEEKVNGKTANHLAFKSKDVDWEMWIEKGAMPVPLRYKIISKNEPESPVFTVDFSDWQKGTGANFADQQFEFTPPANAKKIPFMTLGDAPKQKETTKR